MAPPPRPVSSDGVVFAEPRRVRTPWRPQPALVTQVLRVRGGAAAPTAPATAAELLRRVDTNRLQSGIMMLTMYIGVVMSALSGCITAGHKQMDLLGCIVVGCITALAGGTLRDGFMLKTAFWLRYPSYVSLAITTSVLVFLLWPRAVKLGFKDTHLVFLWSDAIGMAASSSPLPRGSGPPSMATQPPPLASSAAGGHTRR